MHDNREGLRLATHTFIPLSLIKCGTKSVNPANSDYENPQLTVIYARGQTMLSALIKALETCMNLTLKEV